MRASRSALNETLFTEMQNCNFCGSKHKIGNWWCRAYNPLLGCSKVSPGCTHCWAESMARRFYGQKWGKPLIELTPAEAPLYWTKPKRIFAFSMSDLFHEKIADIEIKYYLKIIQKTDWHTFFVLTKRPERMFAFFSKHEVPENLWLGVSIESREYLYRLSLLKTLNHKKSFVSFEPLLSPVSPWQIDKRIGWVIAGCESGPGARPMELDWVRKIRDVCIEAKIPFFFKQAYIGKKLVHLPPLDGVVWAQKP